MESSIPGSQDSQPQRSCSLSNGALQSRSLESPVSAPDKQVGQSFSTRLAYSHIPMCASVPPHCPDGQSSPKNCRIMEGGRSQVEAKKNPLLGAKHQEAEFTNHNCSGFTRAANGVVSKTGNSIPASVALVSYSQGKCWGEDSRGQRSALQSEGRTLSSDSVHSNTCPRRGKAQALGILLLHNKAESRLQTIFLGRVFAVCKRKGLSRK